MPNLSQQMLSDIVGSIYDCAITTERWPETLSRICAATNCCAAAITITAFDGSETRLIHTTGMDPAWIPRFQPEFSHDAAQFFAAALARPAIDLDGPFVLSRLVPPEVRDAIPVYQEWAKPQGLCDNMSAIVLVTPNRVASVDFMRHHTLGLITDDDIATLRLLVPHLRRAITIADLLDDELHFVLSLRASLDGLALPTLIVDANAQILEANAAARDLLAGRLHIEESAGRLATPTRSVTRRLHAAITKASQNESGLAADTLGMALSGEGRDMAYAHILPLTARGIPMRLAANAVAAVFISGAGIQHPSNLTGIAIAYRLTNAEFRMLQAVAGGHGVPEAAASLHITVETGRTHMKHIFAKLGVERHAELIALINRLAPPVSG